MADIFKMKYWLKECMLKSFRLYISFFLIIFCFTSTAQTPTLNSALDKYKILIGEPITLNIEANYTEGLYNLQWVTIQDSSNHFEVIERKKVDTIESGAQIKVSQSIIITSFDSGLRTVPALQVNFKPVSNDSAIILFTDSFKVRVDYSPADSILPFHDIKNIIAVKDEWPLWMKIAAILTAILIIYLIYVLIKKRKKKEPVKAVLYKVSPIDEALRALSTLEKSDWLSVKKDKEFHTSLTEILKRYVHRKFNEPMDNLTSDESVIVLSGKRISREKIAIIANSLKMADAVKFARFQPPVIESNASLINIRKIITELDHQQLNTKSDN